MTITKDMGGRTILEGTVHVVMVFDLGGNLTATQSFIKSDNADWYEHEMKTLFPNNRIVKRTIATYREMM